MKLKGMAKKIRRAKKQRKALEKPMGVLSLSCVDLSTVVVIYSFFHRFCFSLYNGMF